MHTCSVKAKVARIGLLWHRHRATYAVLCNVQKVTVQKHALLGGSGGKQYKTASKRNTVNINFDLVLFLYSVRFRFLYL